MKTLNPRFLDICNNECIRQGLEVSYVHALILKESAGVDMRCRYEPGYGYFKTPEFFANKLGQTLDTEMMQQKFSYGLMQVMGGTARELGFAGYLPELLIPQINIHYGCLYLAQRLKKTGNYPDALAAYNAGSVRRIDGRLANQAYVDGILEIRDSLLNR